MAVICSTCGAENPQGFKYCGYCGESLTEDQQVRVPEVDLVQDRSARRSVTTLFVDLTNFTSAAETADPEMIYRTIRGTLEKLALTVKEVGGRVDRYYGDGFLATFGIPEAHEDDPYRALLASLQMQQQMAALKDQVWQDLQWKMKLRIGISSGQVVSGELDTGSKKDASIFGHAVNLAKRLQSAARPGTVLVDNEVYRRTQTRFIFRDPIELKLKGIDTPIITYELIRERRDPGPKRGLLGRKAPLIGRDREFHNLTAKIEELHIDQQGMAALVLGEAGIGKTRLVEEILPAESSGIRVIRSQGYPYGSSNYGFLKDAVRNLAGINPEENLTSQKARLRDLLAFTGEIGRDIQPTLYELVLNEPGEGEPRSTPQQHQQKIIAFIRHLFTQITLRQPLLILFDDIQWADSSSLDVISHLVELIEEIPLALIFVARSSFRDQLPDFFNRVRNFPGDIYQEIDLQPLSPEECDLLVDSLLEEMEVPPDLKNRIFQRTEGNPLFIEELINIFLDQERRGETDWEKPQVAVDEALLREIPSTIHGLLLNRYDHQPQELKSILDVASVLGPRFHLSLLSAVLQIPEDELQPQIQQLERAGLLRKGAGLSTSLYSFRHALLQEIIYETILFEDRRRLHRTVADTLQGLSGKYLIDDHAVIGYHLERSGSREAAEFLLQAAEESASRYANQEAVSYYQRVQDIEQEGDLPQATVVETALGLGRVFRRLGKTADSLRELEAALVESQKLPLSDYRGGDIHYQLGLTQYELREQEEALNHFLAALTALDDHPESCQDFRRTDVEREIGWVHYRLGRLQEGMDRAAHALDLAVEGDNFQGEGSAHSLLAAIHFRKGQLDRAIQHAESSLLTREHVGDVWRAASSQTTLGHLYHQIGRWDDAEKMLRQAIYVQKEIGDYYTLAGSWTNLGLLLRDRGQYDEALVCMEEAIRILPKHDFPLTQTYTFYINRGSVNLSRKEPKKAIMDFEKSLVGALEQNDRDLTSLVKSYLSQAKLDAGNLNEAKKYLEEVRKNKPEVKEYQAEFFRIRSYVLREEGNFQQALESNAQAQEIIQDIGNQYQYARRLVDQTEIQIAQFEAGDRSLLESHVRDNIVRALEIFEDWGAKADKEWAEEILYQVAKEELTFGEEGFQAEQTLAAVVDINLGSSSLAETLPNPPESVMKLERRLADALSEGAERQNVFLVRSQEGFKYILNFVDHPSTRASLALKAIGYALDAITNCARVLRASRIQVGLESQLKAGIALGTSRELIKDQDHASMFSSISNLGRRAQALAYNSRAYQILISGEIPPAVFEAYELTEVTELKDRRLPEVVYQVGKVLPQQQGVVQRLPSSSKKLVGRSQARDSLAGGFEQVVNSPEGFVVYLEAEAGMGKSRLLSEVRRQYRGEVQVLHGKCEAFRSSISYWPLIELLEEAPLENSPEKRELESILGLSPLSEDDQRMIDNLPPESLKKELFSRTRAFLIREAARKPVVLIFEDVHDLDLSSIELLDYLFPVVYEAPLSIVLISRSEMPGPHRMLVKKAERVIGDHYRSISFSGLSPRESQDLMRAILKVEDLPAGLEKLMKPFIGHPLSIEEGVRYLIEEGWMWKSDQGWSLVDNTAEVARDMPQSFRDILLRRLNFLDHESLHVIQAGSLLGEVFDRVTLSRVIPRGDLAQRLSLLAERGWLRASSGTKPQRFSFGNTLIRESVYSTLLRSKKQLLHQRAGEALESLYPDSLEENIELLAHHFANSGIPEKTLHYSIRAAEKSADRHALEESQRYFRRAQKILQRRNQDRSKMMTRVLLGQADVQIQRGEPTKAIETVNSIYAGQRSISETLYGACLRRLGAAVHLKGDLRRALNIYTKASHELDRDQEYQYNVGGKLVVSAREEFLETQLGLVKVHFDLQNYQETRQLADEVLDMLPRSYSQRAAELYNLLAGLSFQQGDLETAQKQLERSLTIYQTNGNRTGISSIYANLGVMAVQHQNTDQAEEYFLLASEMYQALGDGKGLATIYNNLGQLALDQGKLKEAQRWLQQAADMAHRSELARPRTQALANLGYAHLLDGDEKAARTSLEKAQSLADVFKFPDLKAEAEWKLAACLLTLKEFDKVRPLIDSALAAAREMLNQDLETQTLRVLSRLLRVEGEAKLSLTAAEEAWETMGREQPPRIKAGFAADYALALARAGQTSRAREIKEKYIDPYPLVEPKDVLGDISEELGS